MIGPTPATAPVIIDASVAVNWFVPEPGFERARAVLAGGRNLMAPGLIATEVTGGLLRRFRENLLEERDARKACREWLSTLADGVVEVVDNASLIESAIDTAFLIRHAFPDCLYVTLARETGGTLVTFDQKAYSAWRIDLLRVADVVRRLNLRYRHRLHMYQARSKPVTMLMANATMTVRSQNRLQHECVELVGCPDPLRRSTRQLLLDFGSSQLRASDRRLRATDRLASGGRNDCH